jgi:hypothetical protein
MQMDILGDDGMQRYSEGQNNTTKSLLAQHLYSTSMGFRYPTGSRFSLLADLPVTSQDTLCDSRLPGARSLYAKPLGVSGGIS